VRLARIRLPGPPPRFGELWAGPRVAVLLPESYCWIRWPRLALRLGRC